MPLSPTKIKARREALNLSQGDVASRIGIAQPNYAAIESGRRNKPSLELAEKIAKALEIALEKLLN